MITFVHVLYSSGILVASLYAIWNHAYFSLKSKKTSGFAFLMIITVVISVIDHLGLWGRGPEIVEGIKFGIVGFSCLCMGATIILRNHLDNAKEGDD